MHPLLARDRLWIYLVAWIPIGGLLAVLVGVGNRRSWQESLALALPLALIYAFICLGSWSLCRSVPLGRASVGRIAAALGAAAAISSAIWTLIGRGWALALGRIMEEPEAGLRFNQDIPIFFGSGMLLFTLAAAVHYLLIAFEASRAAETRTLELQVLARDARLETLQAQVNPHFLFNSLNAISSLTGSEPAAARRMCILLAAFLRRSLSFGSRKEIHLEEEMSLVDDFLAIETVRFGTRLIVDRRMEPGTERVLLPPLVLQPLIENAVNHGIATLVDGGTVAIATRLEAGRLVLTVHNPFDPDSRSSRVQGGLGLTNVRARLAAIHGSAAHVAVTSSPGTFRVDITLPAVTDPQGSSSPSGQPATGSFDAPEGPRAADSPDGPSHREDTGSAESLAGRRAPNSSDTGAGRGAPGSTDEEPHGA